MNQVIVVLDLTDRRLAGLQAATAAHNDSRPEGEPALGPEGYVAFVMGYACDSYANQFVGPEETTA